MKIPALRSLARHETVIAAFGGLNRTDSAMPGELSDMRGMSADAFPALSTRSHRFMTSAPHGMPQGFCGGDKLCTVLSGGLYVNGVLVKALANGAKHMTRMGAELIIFPDKVSYHLETGVCTPLDHTFVCPSGTSAARSLMDGALDASGTYARVSAPGIEEGFCVDDVITVSGDGALSGTRVIYGLGENFVVLSGDPGEVALSMESVTLSRDVPDLEFVFTLGNRVFGCVPGGHEIRASRLGDPRNFGAYLGVATDSYAVSTGAGDAFTGACAFMGVGLFFTEDCVYKLFGSRPSNFECVRTPLRGVKAGCERALCEAGGTLFYVTRGGVMAYDGGFPACVSAALGDLDLFDASAGGEGDVYHLCGHNGSGTYLSYAFHARSGLWHIEDEGRVHTYARSAGRLYALREDGLWRLREPDEGDTPAWYAETAWLFPRATPYIYVYKLILHAHADEDALLTVETQCEGDQAWSSVAELNAGQVSHAVLPLVAKRCHRMRVRLSGTGSAVITRLALEYSVGSEMG